MVGIVPRWICKPDVVEAWAFAPVAPGLAEPTSISFKIPSQKMITDMFGGGYT